MLLHQTVRVILSSMDQWCGGGICGICNTFGWISGICHIGGNSGIGENSGIGGVFDICVIDNIGCVILLPLDRYSCDIGEDSLPISGGGEICNHLDITVIFIIIIFFILQPSAGMVQGTAAKICSYCWGKSMERLPLYKDHLQVIVINCGHRRILWHFEFFQLPFCGEVQPWDWDLLHAWWGPTRKRLQPQGCSIDCQDGMIK